MILYIDATRKLLELINEFGKVAGYKINARKKYIAILYTNNERVEREIQEAIPFIIASQRIKHLEINLPRKAKNLNFKNCKMLMKETGDYTDGKM